MYNLTGHLSFTAVDTLTFARKNATWMTVLTVLKLSKSSFHVLPELPRGAPVSSDSSKTC